MVMKNGLKNQRQQQQVQINMCQIFFTLSLLFTYNVFLSKSTVSASVDEYSKFLCFAMCVAKECNHKPSASLDCDTQCRRKTLLTNIDSNACPYRVVDIESIGATLTLSAKYSDSSPYLVDLSWDRFNQSDIDIIQWRHQLHNESNSTWLTVEQTISANSLQFRKPDLCGLFEFRLLSFDFNGSIQRSSTVSIADPDYTFPDDFSMQVSRLHYWAANESLSVYITYTVAAGWQPGDVVLKQHLEYNDCVYRVTTPYDSEVQVSQLPDSNTFVWQMPSNLVNANILISNTSKESPQCSLLTVIQGMTTKCSPRLYLLNDQSASAPKILYLKIACYHIENPPFPCKSACNRMFAVQMYQWDQTESLKSLRVAGDSCVMDVEMHWNDSDPINQYLLANNSITVDQDYHCVVAKTAVLHYEIQQSDSAISSSKQNMLSSINDTDKEIYDYAVHNPVVIKDLLVSREYQIAVVYIPVEESNSGPSKWVQDIKNVARINLGVQAIADQCNNLRYNKLDLKKLLIPLLVVGTFCIIAAVLLFKFYKIRQQQFKMSVLKYYADTLRGKKSISQRDKWEIDRREVLLFEDKVLGKGAFGKVFKGQLLIGGTSSSDSSQHSLPSPALEGVERYVAIKMCHEFASNNTKNEFVQEIALSKSLGYNERLVNMLYCITDSEPFCLIVEFCSDGDLLHFLRERRKYMLMLEDNGVDLSEIKPDSAMSGVDFSKLFSLKEMISFGYQISDGMEFLSEKGLVHRDLAARNILVDKGKKAKIGDFGLSRFVKGDNFYISRSGKLPLKWMALESIRRYEFTTNSDVWSFAVLLFEIITLGGVPYADVMPLDGDFRKAMLVHLTDGNRIEKPENCPNDIYQLMMRCWHAEPLQRPSFTNIKETLRERLENLANENYIDYYVDPMLQGYYLTHLGSDDDSVLNMEDSMDVEEEITQV